MQIFICEALRARSSALERFSASGSYRCNSGQQAELKRATGELIDLPKNPETARSASEIPLVPAEMPWDLPK